MRVKALAKQYEQELARYVDGADEEGLLHAYELGRKSIEEGFGVLETAALHQEALTTVVLLKLGPDQNVQLARRASEFFAECLAAFEMRERGFQDAYALLRDLNRSLEERVRERTARVREHERMEQMKDEFIAMVSHELRTPLTSIQGSLSLVSNLMGGELSPRARELVEIAWRNSERLVRLVDGMLDVAKIEAGKLELHVETIEVLPLVRLALAANESYGRRFGVRFALQSGLSGSFVKGDSDRLIQVLTNLLSNAAKFSPAGETVEVRIDRRLDSVRVEVHDHGPGIPEEVRGQLFQKFGRIDNPESRDRGGTGLGLVISKAIVESLGGKIGFESSPGAGTTFFFELPEVVGEGAIAGERRENPR